jgi:hypothetical protein
MIPNYERRCCVNSAANASRTQKLFRHRTNLTAATHQD